MTTRTPLTRAELEQIVAEYRHLHEEHRRAGGEGSVRRHLGSRLTDLEHRFERLLEEWVEDERLREAWRRFLYEGGPAPDEPGPQEAALLFKGRSDAGSIVEVRERRDGDCDVAIDGALVERIAPGEVAAENSPLTFHVGGQEFREVFDAPVAALAAARGYFAEPEGEPPWEHARELAADGLVDGTFALTPRGRRALATRGGAG